MDLPETFASFVQEQRQFNKEQKAFNEEQRAFNKRTEERLNSLQGSVDNLKGPFYELKTAANLRTILRQHLGLRNARILKGPNREADEEFAAEMTRPRRTGPSPRTN